MFIMETILVGVLPAIPILFFIYSRGYPSSLVLKVFYGLIVKFAALHVLFEISGVYEYSFGA
jgi:hypothetical protein